MEKVGGRRALARLFAFGWAAIHAVHVSPHRQQLDLQDRRALSLLPASEGEWVWEVLALGALAVFGTVDANSPSPEARLTAGMMATAYLALTVATRLRIGVLWHARPGVWTALERQIHVLRSRVRMAVFKAVVLLFTGFLMLFPGPNHVKGTNLPASDPGNVQLAFVVLAFSIGAGVIMVTRPLDEPE